MIKQDKMTKRGIVSWIMLVVACCSTVYAQDNVSDSKDEIYIPKNLPDVIMTKQEARGKFSTRYSNYPHLKFSVMTDPLFVAFLWGPYVRFDFSLSNVTLFAAMGYSSPGGLLFQGDIISFFSAFNLIVSAQGEDYPFLMLLDEGDLINNKPSVMFEGGIIFGGLPKVVSEKSFSIFVRYASGGGYSEKTYEETIYSFIPQTYTVVEQYTAKLIEVVGVFRKPWGKINIVDGKVLYYFTTDTGLGLGVLSVEGTNDTGNFYKKTSFIPDLIIRLNTGVAF